MKNLFLLMILTILSITLYSQDIIIKVDKTEIKSKVLEITEDNIKYKDFGFLDGPTYNIKKSEVFMVIYQNGKKEYIINKIEKNHDDVNKRSSSLLLSTKKNNDTSTDTIIKYRGGNLRLMISSNFHFNGIEGRVDKRIFKFTQLGISYYSVSGISLIYPHITFNYLSNPKHNSISWISLGMGITPAIDSYGVSIPTTTGFNYEFGEDYYFSKQLGISLYFPKADAIFLGIIWRPGNR